MNDTPFDTIGDEPVEARIVAWVLGESSAFEAAELERLCEERPELLVFRRRMRALHGLLTEAEAAAPDHSWKLPPEKRRLLDEIFGEEKVVQLDPRKELRIPRNGRRAFLAIAACIAITFFVARLAPWKYEAEATLEVKPRSVAGSPSNPFTPQFFGTEFEKIKSRSSLEKVVENLDLPQRWKIDKESAIKRVKDSIETRNLSGTDLISIKVRDASERDAQEITQEVVEAYKKYRADIELRAAEKGSLEFKKAIQDQEDKVEEGRKVLATIVRTKGIIYKGQDSFYGPSGVDKDQGARKSLETYDQLLRDKTQLETQIGSLMKMDSEQLIATASGLDLPDNIIRNLNPQYLEAKRQLEALKINGEGEHHPKVLAAKNQVKEMKHQLDEGVINLRATLQAKLDVAQDSLESVEIVKNDTREEAIQRGLDAQGYVDAKREFETDQQLLQSMKLKQINETITRQMTDESIVVHEMTPPVESKNAKASVAIPAAPSAGSGKGGSFAMSNPRPSEPKENARQLKLAKQPNTSQPLAFAEGAAGPAMSDADALSEMEALPAIATASGLGGNDSGFNDPRPRVAPPSQPLPKSKKLLVSGSASSSRGKLSAVKDSEPPSEILAASSGLSAEDRFDTDDQALTNGLRSGDQAINRNQDERLGDQGAAADAFAEADVPQGKLSLLMGREVLPSKPEPQKLVDLIEEVPAAENPYSTFSLNISDASFQLAKAALGKGERPDPESIKPEQFYNAVDYGDPAPASNEPVAATIEQSAHPIIPGRNLVRVALRTGSAGRSAAQPLRLTLLVDQSGSMVREDRRASMEHALSQLAGLLTKADLVTVIGFSRIPHLLAEAKPGDEAGKFGDLINQTASEGGTNLEEAMKLGGKMAARHQLAGAQNRIVLFTDGAANLGDANPARLAEQVKSFRQNGIAFDIAGIGADGLNDRLLSELARNGNGRYYVVSSENNDSFARQLAGAFRPAAENVKVQVNFNPQRVGKYKLIGFEKDRLKTEDFRNDTVDAAELAAEEAGVAIYQVEPLAAGTGELGEVSVRFRDAASGQMVERAWTIPYAAQATAFDRATPSMQLAGLSLLAAEKLKGGPLADAIDFKQLIGPSAFVKQFYGSSPRVGEMLQVIEKLK